LSGGGFWLPRGAGDFYQGADAGEVGAALGGLGFGQFGGVLGGDAGYRAGPGGITGPNPAMAMRGRQ
jgi:hypothetical protein